MTKIVVPRETWPGETRVPLVPSSVRRLIQLGAQVEVEPGLGASVGHADDAYRGAGATLSANPVAALGRADVILKLRPPRSADASLYHRGAVVIGYMDPFGATSPAEALARQGVTALSMELIPRTTIAQKMDALSSQASLAGYVAVIVAAERIQKVLPMMMTPAGTISAARVFIIGAGVAGLQAIATARRLGARVEAYDTRPVVEEQVLSLGARFVKLDIGETGQTKDGYARQLTEEQIAKQRLAMAKHVADADIVISTAQVFGRKAPVIVTAEMVRGMRPGSVIVDLAVETGGNVEGSELDREANVNGVRIVGLANMPARVALDASLMYSSNLVNLIEHFWDKKEKAFHLNREDEIIRGCLLTHDGQIVNPAVKGRQA